MEMTIYGGYEDRFRGLEKQEEKWATNSRFTLNDMPHTQAHIIVPLKNRLYMDFKNIHEIPHMNHMDQNYPIDVSNRSENTCLIDTIRVVFNTESHFDDLARPSRIKCMATGDHAYENMWGRGQVIVVLKMWRLSKTFTKLIYVGYFGLPELWLETDGGLSDFRFNPLSPEVEEFRQSVNNSDPYFWFYLMY
ncbi:unnamed protein product [Brassica rapa]|uniref:Uncharacterized protein n=2 Tax=Brassica campestris TaxID=3711 RepID=A0A8D9HLE5_BRACM|nr:unnamed protein product [Brassica rapa]